MTEQGLVSGTLVGYVTLVVEYVNTKLSPPLSDLPITAQQAADCTLIVRVDGDDAQVEQRGGCASLGGDAQRRFAGAWKRL